MAIFLTSGNPLGYRALGSGGRSAAAAYEQIVRTLRQALGPDHAALFAEPNARGSVIDWFAHLEADHAPKRLTDGKDAEVQAGLERLDRLTRDIEAKIASFQKSDRQDERILGEMLAHALEFPDESAVFLVGAEPVITFWGYVLDKGRPAVSPLRSLLLRRRPVEPVTQGFHAPNPCGAALAAGAVGMASVQHETVAPVRKSRFGAGGRTMADDRWIMPAILWTTLGFLALACLLELMRGCAIGLPAGLASWLADSCVESASLPGDGLASEQAKQDRLRAEYNDLIQQAERDRKSCQIKTGKNEEPIPKIPPPVILPAPKPQPVVVVDDKDKLRIPDKPTDIGFLSGCWKAHKDLSEIRGGKDTGKKLDVNFCFNKDGTGATTIRYREDGAKCTGPLTAVIKDQVVKIDYQTAYCDGGHGPFLPGTATCKSGAGGIAHCDEYSGNNPKPDFEDFPFIRASDNP